MHLPRPPHPGELLLEQILPMQNMDVAAFALHLRVSLKKLTLVTLGFSSISPNLAKRLELAGIHTARYWLCLQADYDRWNARQRVPIEPLFVLPLAANRRQ